MKCVTPRIRKNELPKLTNGSVNSQMLYKLRTIKEDEVAVIIKRNNKYIGWSLTYGMNSGKPKSMFYIREEYRMSGLGRELFEKTEQMLRRRGYKAMYVSPWDPRSQTFFTNMGCGLDQLGKSNSDLFHWFKLL